MDANLELGLPVDGREYGIGSQILVDLGITTMRLMTNNPAKYGGLEGFGLKIVERVPLQSRPTPQNLRYLRTKRERMGHLLELPGEQGYGGSDEPENEHGHDLRRHLRARSSGGGRRYAIAASRFNQVVVDRLVAGARDELRRHGVAAGDVDLAWVPGSWSCLWPSRAWRPPAATPASSPSAP